MPGAPAVHGWGQGAALPVALTCSATVMRALLLLLPSVRAPLAAGAGRLYTAPAIVAAAAPPWALTAAGRRATSTARARPTPASDGCLAALGSTAGGPAVSPQDLCLGRTPLRASAIGIVWSPLHCHPGPQWPREGQRGVVCGRRPITYNYSLRAPITPCRTRPPAVYGHRRPNLAAASPCEEPPTPRAGVLVFSRVLEVQFCTLALGTGLAPCACGCSCVRHEAALRRCSGRRRPRAPTSLP